MHKLKIGIVGCGAIGASLAKAIASDFKKEASLVALYDSDPEKSRKLSGLVLKARNLAVGDLSRLIKESELVIECASAASSWQIAKNVLTKRKDAMIMSVGGIAGHYKELASLAKEHNVKVYIPSGAIAGIDALKAARAGGIKKVVLTTRKPPGSFKGVEYVKQKGIDLGRIHKDTVLFYGSAKAAVKLFPQNINVAAVLSIAGIGQEKTRVRIIASPGLKRNIHEIMIDSKAAIIKTCTQNLAHLDNPKTSYLAVLSAVATLKQILNSVRVGT